MVGSIYPTNSKGHIQKVDNQKGAFGETSTSSLSPLVQLNFPHAINTKLTNQTTTGSGTVTWDDGHVLCSTTAATSSSAIFETREVAKYRAGMGLMARFTTIYTTGVENSTQYMGLLSGDSEDGWAFGYSGATFGILRRHESVDDFIPQSDWNKDCMTGGGPSGKTLDPTKGNVYTIQIQYLGYGGQFFYIEDADTAMPILVHVIKYANQVVDTSIHNPSLPIAVHTTNTTNNTNIVTKTASMSAFVEGKFRMLGPKFSLSSLKSSITTETSVLTIRNKSTYHGRNNRVRIVLEVIAPSTDGTKTVNIKVVRNATLGGTPSYTDVDTVNSVVDYDTAGTTVTGGTQQLQFAMGKVDAMFINVKDLIMDLAPSETMTFSATSPSNTEVTMVVNWVEDV